MNRLLCIALLALSFNAHAASWECISRAVMCHTWRMATPNGWIVSGDNSAGGGEHGYAMTYVPDEKHEWKI